MLFLPSHFESAMEFLQGSFEFGVSETIYCWSCNSIEKSHVLYHVTGTLFQCRIAEETLFKTRGGTQGKEKVVNDRRGPEYSVYDCNDVGCMSGVLGLHILR